MIAMTNTKGLTYAAIMLKVKDLQELITTYNAIMAGQLNIDEDYRTSKNITLDRFLYPLDESSNFKFNKFFRKVTKDKKKTNKILEVKGRKLLIENFYDGVIKLTFDEICNRNLGSEDYIEITKHSDLIFIENL